MGMSFFVVAVAVTFLFVGVVMGVVMAVVVALARGIIVVVARFALVDDLF